ncbi:MAG: WecB/TagA/CpsF family glycosyltransferase, partial [Parvularculaceae bacterium]
MPVDLATAPEAVQAIETAVRDRQPLSFVTPNVNFLVRCLRDSTARREIINADLSLIDGAPLVALGRLAGVPIRERCAGSDVFNALRLRPGFPGRRLKVFFFGGREGAAQAAAEAVNKEARGVEAVGFLNPGNGDVASMSDDETIAAVNAAG